MTRNELIAAFNQGVASGGIMADCFWPGHRLAIVRDGKTIDDVICFQCGAYRGYQGKRRLKAQPIDKSSQAAFESLLKQANIPLSPPAR